MNLMMLKLGGKLIILTLATLCVFNSANIAHILKLFFFIIINDNIFKKINSIFVLRQRIAFQVLIQLEDVFPVLLKCQVIVYFFKKSANLRFFTGSINVYIHQNAVQCANLT